jgi:hypothetical protein
MLLIFLAKKPNRPSTSNVAHARAQMSCVSAATYAIARYGNNDCIQEQREDEKNRMEYPETGGDTIWSRTNIVLTVKTRVERMAAMKTKTAISNPSITLQRG